MIDMSKGAHQPRLDTIRMIEDFIREHNGEYTRTELWKKLPKKTMYQTYKVAIDYLMESKKITLNGRKVIWIFEPDLLEHVLKRSVKV